MNEIQISESTSNNIYLKKNFIKKSFEGHYLNYHNYFNCKFINCSFKDIDARLAVFTECVFENCEFTGANFQFTKFKKCNFYEKDNKEIIIEHASFGGATFIGSSVYKNKKVWFKNLSLRSAKFINSELGFVSFKDTSTEDAYFYQNKIQLIDISYGVSTGAVFIENEIDYAIFSVNSFFQIIGSWAFINANKVELRGFKDNMLIANNRDEIERTLFEQLENLNHNYLAFIINGLVSKAKINNTKINDKFCQKISKIIREYKTYGEQFTDEITKVLRVLNNVKAYNNKILRTLDLILESNLTAINQIHSQIRMSLEREYSQYRENCNPLLLVTFHFQNASINSSKEALFFVSELSKVTDFDSISLKEGSLKASVVFKKKYLPPMLFLLLAILNFKSNIELDININNSSNNNVYISNLNENLVSELEYMLSNKENFEKIKNRINTKKLTKIAKNKELNIYIEDIKPTNLIQQRKAIEFKEKPKKISKEN